MNRRRLLRLMCGLSITAAGSSSIKLFADDQSVTTEEQSGDPDLPIEKLEVNLQDIAPLLDVGKAINIKKDPRHFALLMLNIASDQVGAAKPTITTIEEYFRLFNVSAKKADGTIQPFCAAGLSFAACQAYCKLHPHPIEYTESGKIRTFRDVLADVNKYYFLPHCSVQEIVRDSKQRHSWLQKEQSVSTLKPGWLVFFNWPDKNGHFSGLPNHVGVIRHPAQDFLHTVEYNTSVDSNGSQRDGGHIAFKVRNYKYVLGYSEYLLGSRKDHDHGTRHKGSRGQFYRVSIRAVRDEANTQRNQIGDV